MIKGRELVNHMQSSFTAENIRIYAVDEPGAGGASHEYQIVAHPNADGLVVGELQFQHGPRHEVGVNGFVDDALLIILIDRMKAFNEGEFRCRENSLVITHLEEALLWLKARELDRENRGVLGRTQN